MFISKQTLRLILFTFFASFIVPTTIHAFPHTYHRLILEKDGKIVKIIDLISDWHSPEDPNNPDDLGPSEAALYATLQQLMQRSDGETIEFFGESKPEDIKRFKNLKYAYNTSGLWSILYKLHKKYNQESNSSEKKLIYSHANTYRDYHYQCEGQIKIRTTKDFLKRKNPISIDLPKFKQKVDAATYVNMYKLWENFKQHVVIHEQNKAGPLEIDGAIYRNYNFFIHSAMDLEVLMKILSSKHKHNILYAGGWHCENISHQLTTHFNFTLTKNIGKDAWDNIWQFLIDEKQVLKIENQTAKFTLPARTWKHLLTEIEGPAEAAVLRHSKRQKI